MKLKNYILPIILALLFSPTWLAAQQLTTIVSSDVAEISESAPDTDQDDADLMIQSVTGGSYQSFVKFDISSLSGEIGYAAIKFYMAQKEEVSGAGLITPYRVMLLPVDNTSWDNTLTWNLAQTEGLITQDPYTLDFINVMDYNKPFSTGSDSKWYNVTNAIITHHINSKIAAGETSVAFALVAMDSISEHSVWAGGTWRSPELTIMNGVAPTSHNASEVAELFQASPDQSTEDSGDLMLQTTTNGNDILSLVKFDLSGITQPISDAAIQVYGSQHEGSFGALDEYLIEMYEVNDHTWENATLTYNTFNANYGHAADGIAVFDINNPDAGASNLRGIKSKIISNIRMVELINNYINDGKTEISFVFKASTVNDDFDAWFGGTWRGPKLYLEHGIAPVSFAATNDAEVSSAAADAVNPDDNAGDLKIQTTTAGDVIRSYVKFDLEGVVASDIRNATIQVYGAQNEPNPESIPERYLVDVYGVDNTDAIDNTTLTYNISESFSLTTKALGRADFPPNAISNRVHKYKFFDQQAITDYVKLKLEEGATEVGFVMMANDTVDSHDAYTGGVAWRGPEMKISYYSVSEPVEMDTLVGQSLIPVEDSWVGEAEQFANHDGEADMNVTKIAGDSREAFIKFDISASSEADIISLDLIGAQQDNNDWTAIESFHVDVYGVDDNSWAEGGLIWVNKPAVSTEVLASVNVTVTSSITFSFESEEITNYVNSRIAAGEDNVSFAVVGQNETPGSRAWFSSKDWKAPSLQLKYFASTEVAAPVLNPAPGLFAPNSNVSVTMTTATDGAVIYYTTDGSTPTEASTMYEGAFNITGTDGDAVAVRAVSILDAMRSHLTDATYLFGNQTPFAGADPWPIPGVVMGWKYDLGGQGIAYNELTPAVETGCGDISIPLFEARGNEGLLDGCYNPTDDKGTIGWAENGEWAEYTVNVATARCYTVELKYLKATDAYPGSIAITTVDDNGNMMKELVDTTALFMNTATENDWGADAFELPSHNFDAHFTLEQGTHVIRVLWVENNWNLAQLEFHPSSECDDTSVSHFNALDFNTKVYPNPANHTLNVEMESTTHSEIDFQIIDLTGRVIQSLSRTTDAGHTKVQFDISHLEQGIYFVSFTMNNQRIVKRFSKVEF